jgi:hypothetical protein
MKSIRNEQFNQPLAENQDEYHTLFINLNTQDPMCPATACFELSLDEIEEITKTGKIYYNQCLFLKPIYGGLDEETGLPKVIGFGPREQFHPMNINVYNPLEPMPEIIPVPLIPLTEMSGDHFKRIFYAEGYAPALIKGKIGMFKSLYGFASCIANIGRFNSYRLAYELGYDVEFTLDPLTV